MKKKQEFKVKSENGMVDFAMRTGKVFVKSKMPLSLANYHITTGTDVKIDDARGYGQEICVDDTYFFPPTDHICEECNNVIPDNDEVTE